MGSLNKPLLLVGLAAAALAGCTTPQYPTTTDYRAPPPIEPKYPITKASLQATEQGAPPALTPAVQTEPLPSPASAAPSPAAVQSSPLPPLVTAPPAPTSPSATSPEQAAPPPTYTPPPRQAYSPPPVRRAETRLVTGGKVVTAHGMYRSYQVQPGDHLDAIARDLKTTRDELIDANRLKRPYRIHPGERIKAPVAKAYVVEGGDTLSGVARRFGVGLGELASLNDLPERGRLTAGMYVALPDNYNDHGPTRETVAEEVRPEPRVMAETRPHATYRPEPYVPTPYTPSAAALAAAASRRESAGDAQAYATNRSYDTPRSYATTPAEPPANTAAIAQAGQGRFIWPVRGDILSQFGAQGMGRRNDGVDIGAPMGSEVKAAAVGEVVYAGDQVPGFGNLVLIKHAGGWVSAYAHLGSVNVHMRDTVYQGQAIGTVGETGGVSQPQLHFEMRYASNPAEKARPLDPLQVLPK